MGNEINNSTVLSVLHERLFSFVVLVVTSFVVRMWKSKIFPFNEEATDVDLDAEHSVSSKSAAACRRFDGACLRTFCDFDLLSRGTISNRENGDGDGEGRMCRAGSEVYKKIMNLQRRGESPVPPVAGVVGEGTSAMDGTLEQTISTASERIESFDRQKMAKLLRACLLAKYLRNDHVPCELQEGLYLGSIGAAFNKGLLQNLNVTHILSVANAVDMPFPHDFKYMRIDVLDSADVNLAQHFNTCFSFIDEARMAGGGVLVHCFAGRSRSVTVVVAYLMRTYGMRLVQALSHVTSRRKEAQPNPGFMGQLQDYDRLLEEARRV